MTDSLPRMLTVAVISAAVSLSAALPGHTREIEVGDLYDLPPADVVFLGEVHDNAAHHAHQAIAVEAIGAKALVFEMLTDAQALRVTPDLLGDPGALGHVLGWEASGWPDFEMYYPIFVATDAAVFGGALERDDVRRAVSDGAAAVMGAGAAVFGLDTPLAEEEQALRESGQMLSHCNALPEEMLGGMVEAQRLRDAALARAVIAAHAETGGPVAVITGNGHARTDWGIPRALGRAMPELTQLSIAQLEGAPEGEVPYDLWLVTEAAEREDPCLAFSDR